MSGDTQTTAAAWLEAIVDAGAAPPLLIVADNAAIAAEAQAWEAALSPARWRYRVRLAEVTPPFGDQEAEAVAAEAASLGAKAILAAGGGELLAVAAKAAAFASVPLILPPSA